MPRKQGGPTRAVLAFVIGAIAFVPLARAGVLLGHASLRDLTVSAARVFRGRCVAAVLGSADVAGARLPVTTYTFEIVEPLKGPVGDVVTFRQVGSGDGGPRDLGARVGLPTYRPGTEYVLFLLPESVAGLTSPAGAAEGVLEVRGDRIITVGGRTLPALPTPRAAPRSADTMSYQALRDVVRAETGP